MTAPRLTASMTVSAILRTAQSAGAFAAVLRRGAPEAGDILLKLNDLAGGLVVLGRASRGDGGQVWLRLTGEAPVDDAAAEALIARRRAIDPDLWVVEIEDRALRHFHPDPLA